jgi:2,4-dienoyl-CoA reductase-like NADH-dependent reductase (Old Yellow Enzyme family)
MPARADYRKKPFCLTNFGDVGGFMNDVAFTPCKIGNLEIKNRFVMSAAVDGLAGNLDARIQRYSDFVDGGIGLVISGCVHNKNESFEKVVEAVHQRGGKIALQILSHIGLGFVLDVDSPAASIVSKESPIFSKIFPYGKHHEASEVEIMGLIGDYVNAARMAKEFGVDAIQVHSAHNSSMMQFLTPLINQRKDKWSGSVENRVRVHKEVYKALRAEVGGDIPIFIKLGVEDPFPGGLKIGEGKVAARLLAEYGYDAIEISQGLQDFGDPKTLKGTPLRMGTVKISQEAYFRDWCREIKKIINKPTIMTGGIRSYELVHEMLANDETDFIVMCRPFIREPGLVNRWEIGDHHKATCISCNKCGAGLMKGLPLACYVKEKWDFELL